MKKTSKAIMGVTALIVAFSACAFTACNSQPADGSIKGNYQEATAEQVNEALSTVDQDTLFGDTTADGYKFGIELSSDYNISLTSGVNSASIGMNADYKMLISKGESGFSTKGAGSFNLNSEVVASAGTASAKTSSAVSLNLYQEDAMMYASLAIQTPSAVDSKLSYKIKADLSEVISNIIPSGGIDAIVPSLPDGVTAPELPSFDLINVLNELNAMGATTSMDISNGIKLKISIGQDFVNNMIASMMDGTTEAVSEMISFSKCSLDFYLAIDKSGMLNATSIVADVEATVATSESETSATTLKIKGYERFAVNAKVNPEIPANLSTDLTYFDETEAVGEMLSSLIQGIIDSGITGNPDYGDIVPEDISI